MLLSVLTALIAGAASALLQEQAPSMPQHQMSGVPGDLIPPGVPPELPQSPDSDSPPGVDPSILTPQVCCHIPEGSIGLDR